MKRYKQYMGWAIDTCSESNHGLIGVYWPFKDKFYPIPPQCKVVTTAVFRTRREAREALLSVKKGYAFPRSKVVKVNVKIEAMS